MPRISLLCALFLLASTPCRAADCPGVGGYLNGENIENFIGCSRVMGNVIINEVSFQSDPSLTMEKLSVLSNITEVDGYVQVENTNHAQLTHLRFLHNLESIRGHETLEVLPTQFYSLVISGNDFLQTLNLASLRRVENGGIRITNNQELCLVDTISIEDYLVGSSLSKIGGYAQDCSGIACHDQCELSRGCWGTLADECVQCRSFSYLGTCVEACNESISYTDDTTMSCVPLPTMVSVSGGVLSPQYTFSDTTTNSATDSGNDDGNRTSITHWTVTETPVSTEATTDNLEEAKWKKIVPIIAAISCVLLIGLIIISIILVIYKSKKRDSKSRKLSMAKRRNTKSRKAELIKVGRQGELSHGGEGSREAVVTRRQHVCATKASDEAYNHGHDAASPEPEVIVMVEPVETIDHERYVIMPYEHEAGALSITSQSSRHGNANMSMSRDSHVTDPLYESIDSQPYYESVKAMPHGASQGQSLQTPNHVKSKLKSRNSGSSLKHSLAEGAVYSTHTTKSHRSSTHNHTHSSPPPHRGSLTSSHAAGTREGQRTIGRGSRMGHRLSTAGTGSVVSSSRAGTSTQGSVNSIMTMNE